MHSERSTSVGVGALTLEGLRAGVFMAEQGSTSTVTVEGPQVVVGRSPDAAVRITDTAARVSRMHLVLERAPMHWAVRDCASTHGTAVKDRGRQLSLPPWLSQPITDGMVLVLGGQVEVRVKVEHRPMSGVETAAGSPPLVGVPVPTLLDDQLLPVALELTAPYRESPSRHDCASVATMLDRLPLSRSAVYNRLRALAQLPDIEDRLHAPVGSPARGRELAAALVIVYPMLSDPMLGVGSG